MFTGDYGVFHNYAATVGGIIGLAGFTLVLGYRVLTSQRSNGELTRGDSCSVNLLGTLVQQYSAVVLPWLLTLVVLRGQATLGCGSYSFSELAIRSQVMILVLMGGVLVLQAGLSAAVVTARWAAETLGCVLCLQVC